MLLAAPVKDLLPFDFFGIVLSDGYLIKMGQAYKIFGMTVKPHYLAIATLLGTFSGAAYFTGSSSNGSSKEEGLSQPSMDQKDMSGDSIDVEKLLDQFVKDTEDEKK